MDCKFCNKIFSSIYTLKYHQENTRYCLIKQGKKKYICNYCNTELKNNKKYIEHLNNCLSGTWDPPPVGPFNYEDKNEITGTDGRASFRTSFPFRSDEMGHSLTDGTSRVAKPVVSLPEFHRSSTEGTSRVVKNYFSTLFYKLLLKLGNLTYYKKLHITESVKDNYDIV